MTESPATSAPDRPANLPHDRLSVEDQRALEAMLDEGMPAPLAALRPGDDFQRGKSTFLVIARADDRLALLGECRTCAFPYIVVVDPRDPKPALSRRCDLHRRRPRPEKPKRRGRPVQAPIDVQHEIEPHRATPNQYSRGDVINRAGHIYVVRGGPREVISKAGRAVAVIDLVGACAECGEMFMVAQSPQQANNPHQTRRCPEHRSPSRAKLVPWKWTTETLAAAKEYGR